MYLRVMISSPDSSFQVHIGFPNAHYQYFLEQFIFLKMFVLSHNILKTSMQVYP
jgi:hypothetical protein